MEIYLVRHGRTTQPGTFTGVTDVALSSHGKAQVRRIAPAVVPASIEHCYCSPLTRCRETVRLLELQCPVTVDEMLREIDFGRWEGLNFAQVCEQFPDDAARWREEQESFTFPLGEQIKTFNTRVRKWFDELSGRPHQRVLVVAHGGVLRIGLCALLGVGLEARFGLNFAEAAVTSVSLKDGFPTLEMFNCRG